MPDPQQHAILSLALLAESCRLSVAALSSPSPPPSAPASPNVRDIHADLLSLLSFIYQSTTKLSIVLNPSNTIYPASISPLQDLISHVNALSSCASLFHTTHGETLKAEVINLVSDVLTSLNALVNLFLSNARNASILNTSKNEYLIRTGTIHKLIDDARGPDGLSNDNLQAVRKKWLADKATLDDAYAELSEMIQDANEDNDKDNFCDDNGLDDLGLGSSNKLSPEEVDRVKKVQPFLRVTTLLHKRILLELLNQLSLPPSEYQKLTSALDNLAKLSSTVVCATDDIVATLYSPQDPSSISPALTSMSQTVKALQKDLLEDGFIAQNTEDQVLTHQLESMTIDNNKLPMTDDNSKSRASKVRDIKGWFDTCFTQIDRLCISLCESLSND